ncbi:hypothetical protein CYCD_04100 [Tenuifilaceae bacterium CYCD]|nr:hypothetical protein CYCD_04100 [Tenuifilaceae bacterium CYCD]
MAWVRRKSIYVSYKKQGSIIYRKVDSNYIAEISLIKDVVGCKIKTEDGNDEFMLIPENKTIISQSTEDLDNLIDEYLKSHFVGMITLKNLL